MKMVKKSQPHVFVHENVCGLPPQELERALGKDYSVHSFTLSPQMSNYPVSRKRLYSLCIRQDIVLVAAVTDFLKTVEDLLCRDPAPSVGDFLLSEKNPDFENVLTASNKKFLKGYESEFGERGITVADLQQNPKKRPRWGSCVMPTLTTGCSKMVHIPSQRLFSGLDLAACHGMPVTQSVATILGTSQLNVGSISNSALCSCVGNNMHLSCIGAAVTAAILFTAPPPKIEG